MTQPHNSLELRNVESVLEEPAEMIEAFIKERPLVAVAIAVTAGAFLARRIFGASRASGKGV